MLRVKKAKILQYDLSSLDNAVKCVKAGEMSVRKAAEHFKVPTSTVEDRVTGKREIVVGRGRKPALLLELENSIVQSVKTSTTSRVGELYCTICKDQHYF
jgi:transposase